MKKRPALALSNSPTRGAIQIAMSYLLIGGLWILFSDQAAARIALNQQMFTLISLYKGWAYVLVTALLLYWLIRRHTAALRASEEQLRRVIDAMPIFISYVDAERRYQFTNRTYKEKFGDQAEGKYVEEVIGKAAYRTVSTYIDKVLSGETTSYETEVPFEDEELFMTATYIPDKTAEGRVKGFFVMAQDRTAQRQAEEEHRLWADAFEGCAHGIAIADSNTNRIVVCNPAFASLHKSRVEEIVGSALLSLHAASDHDRVRHNIEKADQIGHVSYEAHMARRGKDGSTFPVQMDIVSVLGEDGELLHRVVTAQDISERKQAEENLRESEAKYRTLVEHLPAITYISGADEYIGVSYISSQIESYGFDLNTWLADPELWFRHIHPDDQASVTSELQRFQAGAESFKAEYRLTLPSGETRWFHDESIRVKDRNGKTLLKQGFMLDITESKQAEENVRRSEAQLSGIFNSAMDAIISIDAEQRVLIFNPAAEAMFQCAQSEAIGQTLDRFIPERFREIHRRHVDSFGQTGITKRAMKGSAVVYGRRSNGEEFPSEASISQISVAGKKIYTLILRDISARVQAEEGLRQSEERFASVFRSSPTPIALTRLADGKIMDVNEAFCQLLGYSRQEIVGHTSLEIGIADPESRQKAVELLEQKGAIRNLEQRARDRHGRELDILNSVEIINVNGEPYALTTLIDITERKQAEEYLRRFELLSEHSRDIILFMGREDGHIQEANAAAVHAYGYSREELLSLTIRDLRARDTLGLTEAQMAQADAEGILFETVHGHKDGTTFPVEVNSQGAMIGGKRMLISIIRDITERKQAQEALRLKAQLLHLTSEMAKVGGWEFDTETGKGTWTDEVARIHDIDPAQETNVEIGLGFYAGESREKIERAVKEAVELGKPYDLELEMVSAKGDRKWVRTMALPVMQNDKVVKVQGIFQDITQRKQIEKALQTAHDGLELKVQERTAALSEANALLKALMDNMPDHIYFKDLQSRFIRTSKSQAALLGHSDPAEVIGKTDFDFFPHAARAFAEEQEVMSSGKPLIDLEEWVVWPDGRESWVLTTKMPLRNSEGETIGIFGISHDITERKQIEQEIKQLNADLEKQAEQLRSANKELEAFSYSVSHDLRAPLRAIDGYTRILVEDYEAILDAEGKRICGIISREARRMGQLIDDLLAFSRLGRKEMYTSRIDMRGIAVAVLNELLKEEERTRLDFHFGKLPAVKADSALIRQVWFNLLTNAIKFTSKKERAVIEIGSKTSKDEIIYFVRDTGAGFDMEYANKLFGVFQRLHSESEFDGTGVGLAIVQRIIHRHEGRVWAEGEVDKGATFYFALPRKEGHHE